MGQAVTVENWVRRVLLACSTPSAFADLAFSFSLLRFPDLLCYGTYSSWVRHHRSQGSQVLDGSVGGGERIEVGMETRSWMDARYLQCASYSSHSPSVMRASADGIAFFSSLQSGLFTASGIPSPRISSFLPTSQPLPSFPRARSPSFPTTGVLLGSSGLGRFVKPIPNASTSYNLRSSTNLPSSTKQISLVEPA